MSYFPSDIFTIIFVILWTFWSGLSGELPQRRRNRVWSRENHLDALRIFTSFVVENKNKLDRLVNSKNWIQIEGILVESVAMYLDKIARSKFSDIEISYDDMEMMLRFYASGMGGGHLHYSRKNQLDEEKLIRQIEKIITGRSIPLSAADISAGQFHVVFVQDAESVDVAFLPGL